VSWFVSRMGSKIDDLEQRYQTDTLAALARPISADRGLLPAAVPTRHGNPAGGSWSVSTAPYGSLNPFPRCTARRSGSLACPTSCDPMPPGTQLVVIPPASAYMFRMSITTLARLKAALDPHFDAVGRTARRMREAGLIDAGTAGRDGVGSAKVSIRQAVLLLLALASNAEPIAAPAEAQRIAAFKLLRHDETRGGEPPQRTVFENQSLTLLDALVNEIERCDADRPPSAWDIATNGACQANWDRLVFGPSLETLTDPADSDCVVRFCRLPSRLLGDIAELFRAADAKAAA